MHFARVAGENLVSPDEKATAIGAYVFLGFLEAYGFGVARGGAGKLTDALIACIRDHGGEVLANADVARIKVTNGRASGVSDRRWPRVQREGRRDRRHPPASARRNDRRHGRTRARRTRKRRISPMPPASRCTRRWTRRCASAASDPVDAVMVEMLPASYETLRRDFDELRYGQFMPVPLLGLGSLSQFDPSRVPPGKAILHCGITCLTERLMAAAGTTASWNTPTAC